MSSAPRTFEGRFRPSIKPFAGETAVQMEALGMFMRVSVEKLLCVFQTWQSTAGTSYCF